VSIVAYSSMLYRQLLHIELLLLAFSVFPYVECYAGDRIDFLGCNDESA
jgi:hypothetical protein